MYNRKTSQNLGRSPTGKYGPFGLCRRFKWMKSRHSWSMESIILTMKKTRLWLAGYLLNLYEIDYRLSTWITPFDGDVRIANPHLNVVDVVEEFVQLFRRHVRIPVEE